MSTIVTIKNSKGALLAQGIVISAQNYGTIENPDWHVEFNNNLPGSQPGYQYIKQVLDGYALYSFEFGKIINPMAFPEYVICIYNTGSADELEFGKVYHVVDTETGVGTGDLLYKVQINNTRTAGYYASRFVKSLDEYAKFIKNEKEND